nr:LysM peptidoglycan-binding domain-containing protein [Listeria fleischmannii]
MLPGISGNFRGGGVFFGGGGPRGPPGAPFHSAPNYNLFGIKGTYNGQAILKETLEDDGNGNYSPIKAYFRKYPSYHESLQDYARVIRNGPTWNPLYYSGAWKSNSSSYLNATQALTGTYATDTSYSVKLNNLIKTYNLTQYDTPSNGSSNISNSYHTVAKGDTLWNIATRHGLSVTNLKSLNNLKTDTIHIGQKLVIKKTSNGSNNTSASTYRVASGDTLWKIAKAHKTTVSNLKSWNKLSSNTIHIGQTLIVSNSSSTSSNTSTSTATYTVKKGDTLWSIASKNKVSLPQLKTLNKLTNNTIYVGQKLKLK